MRDQTAANGAGHLPEYGMFKWRKLSYVENEMLQDVMRELVQDRPVQKVNTACRNFYRGCSCRGCELAEQHNPFNWPKVGETRRATLHG